ncbi:MAG: DUF6153 family protein [Actinomycetota bacterium]|nr:DUF6153 family protein [Actinomycetota bacterium]
MVRRRPEMHQRHVRVLLIAMVSGVVFGLIGMHSLTQEGMARSEGVHSFDMTPTGHGTATPVGPAMDGHDQHEKGPSDPADHCGMLALCLAALVGGSLLLWAAFAAVRTRPTAHIRRVSTSIRIYVQTVFRSPPDLISLSILRC